MTFLDLGCPIQRYGRRKKASEDKINESRFQEGALGKGDVDNIYKSLRTTIIRNRRL
jgi:hypothetical protein